MHLSAQAAVAIYNAMLHQNLQDLFVGTVEALASAVDARDPYTERHSARVGTYAVAIGRNLGFSEERLTRLHIASLLHDIGKIGIRDHVLLKPGRLDEHEYAVIRQHPAAGARIIRAVERLQPMLPFMYHHHERYCESGYPEGIQGEGIPLEARVIAVADAFDAMTTDRPYRRALPVEVAAAELRQSAGTQLDPLVVHVFLDLVAAGEAGIDGR